MVEIAIFKILKGDSSRISLDKTSFHEGYAYFTPDTGGFFIDAIVGAENKRIQINPPPKESSSVNATLSSSGWTSGAQTVSIKGMTASANGTVGLASTATADQVKAATLARLTISAQASGSITVKALGTVPAVDIPITVVMF